MVYGFINAAELADLRTQAESFMSDSCYLLTKTNSIDASGNMVETLASTGPHSCRFAHLERVEGVFGGVAFEREASKTWYTVSLPTTVTVTRGDKLQKGTAEYEVLRTFNDETLEIATRCLVVSLEGDTS